MKPPFSLSLPMVAATAAALGLGGCGDGGRLQAARGPTRVCADADGVRTWDDHCRQTGAAGRIGGARWYYYPDDGRAVAGRGDRVSGGSYEPARGVSYHEAPRVARGGFGAAGRGFGAGS